MSPTRWPDQDLIDELRASPLAFESMTTTHRYVEADLTMKQAALARLQEPAMESAPYRPPDELMRFLLDL